MSTNPPSFPTYSPALQSLIPLFYVAWADRVLSMSEVRLLEQKVKTLDFLSDADRQMVQQWCNPKHPPSRELFQHWKILIHQLSEQTPSKSRQSLVDLGLEMAKRSSRRVQGNFWSTPETRIALEELEEALGLVQIETYRSLFSTPEPEKGRYRFDPRKMQSLLDDDFAEIRNRMRNLLSTPAFEYQTYRLKEDYRLQVLKWCKQLAKQGLGALSYPKANGGEDDMGKYAAVFEMLGYHDLSLAIKFGVQFGLFGGSVLGLGTKKHHDTYLEQTGTLELPGCFAMTETGHGSNVRNLETTATYDPEKDTFIIHSPNFEAGKEYIGNALHGRIATVFAQLIVGEKNHGVHAFLVPLRDENHQVLPGIKIVDNGYKLGLNGVDNGRIWFDQVQIPRANLLDRFGSVDANGNYQSPIESASRRFFTMLGTLVGGRVCVPRAGLSAAKSGLAIAIKYALKRRQFGSDSLSPETLIIDYPSHQRRLMPLLAKAYALDFGLTHLTRRFLDRTEEDIREIETMAAGLKAYATWFTTQTLQECREACGGKGYLSENRLGQLKADTEIFTTFEGDNTVLMQLVAKGRLSVFQQEFNEEGVFGLLRFVASWVGTAVTERNPLTVRSTDRDHLLDPQFHLNAFRYREERLLFSVAQRLRSKIKGGMKAYDAFLDVQNHLLQLAEAYVERLVLEQFIETNKQVEDPDLQSVLDSLEQLYALHTIEKNKGWYLEAGYMEGVKTKAVRRLVDELCGTIREDALALVDSFAIPDQLLAAQIAVLSKKN
jgi:acyl-CoA oxidase